MAPDIARRYSSAQEFESDLHAFLKGQATAAESERHSTWDANATVVKNAPRPTVATGTKPTAKPVAASAPKRPRRWNELSNVAIALLAGVLAGVLILIPVSYYYRFWTSAAKLRISKDYAHESTDSINADWTLFEQLKTRGGLLTQLAPIPDLDALMKNHLLSGADNILDHYRSSTDTQLRDFDWAKARLLLQKSLVIDGNDSKAKGKLALVNGYAALTRSTSQASAASSVKNFRMAASYMPHSPDPHVALALVNVKVYHNIGQALAELNQAQQLGYKLGPRENEEEADGYLYRAESEMTKAKRLPGSATADRAKWLTMARDDMDRALALYEPIAGFSNVSAALEQLQQDRQQQVQLETASLHLLSGRAKRWRVFR